MIIDSAPEFCSGWHNRSSWATPDVGILFELADIMGLVNFERLEDQLDPGVDTIHDLLELDA